MADPDEYLLNLARTEYREGLMSSDIERVMSVFASGAIPPEEAIEWVCNLEGLESIVFGASSPRNVRHTKELIERAWGHGPAPAAAV